MTNSINQEGLKNIIGERDDLRKKVSELEDELKLLSTSNKDTLLLGIGDGINNLQENMVSIIQTSNKLNNSILKCDSELLSDQFSRTHKLLSNNLEDVNQLVIKKSDMLSNELRDLQKGIGSKFDQSFYKLQDLYKDIRSKFDQSFDKFDDLYKRVESKIDQITGASLQLDDEVLLRPAEYQFIE